MSTTGTDTTGTDTTGTDTTGTAMTGTAMTDEHGPRPVTGRHSDLLVAVNDLVVTYPAGAGGHVQAVSGVSFDLARGETLGVVGESGCGKSTLGRSLLCLPPPTSGQVTFSGIELTGLSTEALRRMRTQMQLIFQDPVSSLNPARRIADIIAEPLVIWGKGADKADKANKAKQADKAARTAQVGELMEAVGLDPATFAERRAHQLSGGQCQRVSIARALALAPDFLVLDEPVSALDVSVQAQILNLLEEMKARYGLTMVFISHDLSVIRHVSDRICVMYLGKLCEIGARDAVYDTPRHPYTAALIASVPAPDPTRRPTEPPIGGELPSAVTPPAGCRFHTRCPRATAICTEVEPVMTPVAGPSADHAVACHHPLEVGEGLVGGGGRMTEGQVAPVSLGGRRPRG